MKVNFFAKATAAVLAVLMLIPCIHAANDKSKDGYRVYVRGVRINCRVTDGTVCVPFRTFCEEMTDRGAVVSWDGDTNTASAVWSSTVIEVRAGEEYITANGRCFWCGVVNIIDDGTMYVSADALARAFGSETVYNDTRSRITVADGGSIISGDEYYDKTELFWLSRIISAESRGEPLYGKIAVGTVVYNRVASDRYPDTVYGVIFDMKNGVQFSPAYSGSVFRTPTEESVIAAKLCMEGARVPGEPMYFCTTEIMETSWAGRSRPYIATIGGHAFFA